MAVYSGMSMPPSSIPLPGLQWVPGINAVSIQKTSGLHIDAKTLHYNTYVDIRVSQADQWRVINGLLGLTHDAANNRYYLGAPHPLFTDTVKIGGDIERVPMLWVDSIHLTPLDDHYKGFNGEVFWGDGGNQQMLHYKNCILRVNYSNDPFHYSRLKCNWVPKLEQEYIQVGQLFWKDEAAVGADQYNDSDEFVALPTQKYARRCMTAEISYSIAFFMNPTNPGCLPEWCDTAMPIPASASPEKTATELRKLLGSINRTPIELFPYFGDAENVSVFVPNIQAHEVFPVTDGIKGGRAAPAGTLLFADVSCSTEFRPWIFGNQSDNVMIGTQVGLRMMPLASINLRFAYRRSGWNRFWNGLKMDYGQLWWKDALGKTKKDAKLFEERDFRPIQTFIRNNISWNPNV